MKLLVVRDESSKILGHRWLNSQISFYIGLMQLSICVWAMAQHLFSLIRYRKILFCDFVNGTQPVLLVGVDIIIFDIGLFHSLWGIDSCVAQHLDGGYGRFGWCFFHIAAFVICLPFAFVSRPKPYSLWPLLIQQSAYGVGLLILSLAALPRVLPTFTGDRNSASLFSISVYAAGASLNFLLLYIYWHWYWHVEAMWNSARKLRGDRVIINPNSRSKRTVMRYREPYSMNPTTAASEYDVTNERSILMNASGDGSFKESQLDETLLVFRRIIPTDADADKAPSESSCSLPPPWVTQGKIAVQQAECMYPVRAGKDNSLCRSTCDSAHSSLAVCNESYCVENDRTVCDPYLNSNGIPSNTRKFLRALNGLLPSTQAYNRRPPFEHDAYGLRRPRRLLPSSPLFFFPTNRYTTSPQGLSSRPSMPIHPYPLSFAEAELIASTQPMLQYSPFRHFRL